MSPRALPCLLTLALGAGAVPAAAQPAMPDPSAMSGIPRPDPAVPAGTVTVRLIRGELSNRITDADVELWTLPIAEGADKAPPRTAKTDAEGRATFSGLPTGTYEARAAVDGEAMASQPIELPEQPGVRVMLVFSKSVADQQKELGKADGKARVSLALDPGVLVIRALDEKGAGLPGARVTVSHGDRATEKVDTLPDQATDPQGEARFEGLKTGTGDGYLVSVVRDDTTCRGKPFRLVGSHGSLLAIECRKAIRDVSQLKIATASHIILELEDDTLQAVENLRLQNPTGQTIDPGPGGLRIPLPEGALSPQAMPVQEGQAPPVTIDVSRPGEPPVALWKGPVPAGETDLRFAFLLKHRGTLRFRQATPIPFEVVRVIAEKAPDMRIEGVGLETEDRKWQGRDLLLITAPPPAAGGTIEFTVSGLPYSAPIGRYLAGILALAVALGFGLVAGRPARVTGSAGRREQLERRRREVLDQITQITQLAASAEGGAPRSEGRKKKGPAPEALLEELEQIYRDLDELSGRP